MLPNDGARRGRELCWVGDLREGEILVIWAKELVKEEVTAQCVEDLIE